MQTYSAFAKVYDEFMDNVDYEAWAAFIAETLRKNGISKGLVLDLGCGTGKITRLLARAGYDMTGIDVSDQMLQIALEEKDRTGEDILYLCQDMREFELYGTMAAIVSSCDCLNYILEEDELNEVFSLVHNYLDPDGLFIFDFCTPKKYEKIGDSCIAENRESGSFIWENFYDRTDRINEYQLTLFLSEGESLYRKYEEFHVQKGYTAETMKELLLGNGFEIVSVNDGYSDMEADEESERVLIAARCIKSYGGIG